MAKKLIFNILFIISISAFVACSKNNDQSIQVPTATDSSKKLSTSDTLKGARFYKPYAAKGKVYFSNKEYQDDILLTINSGLISESKSNITISSKGKQLYRINFDTYYFIKFIFEPKKLPLGANSLEKRKYLIEYAQSLTKQDIEAYALKQAKSVFKNTPANFLEVQENMEFGFVPNETLFTNVSQDKTTPIIFIPCFDCYEGGDYLVYRNDQAQVLLTMD